MPTVLISSVNYSGQTADITFNPQTGGTINIGSLVIPYYYTADYVYGFYSLFFSAFNSTCTYEILSPTPTPTQTSTRTPTQTSTQTPTQTPTQTMTMTPTQTMTMTPTQTMTMTPTPTRFPACVDCEMSGVSFSTVCYGCYPIAFGKNTKVNSTSYSVVMTFDGGVNYNYTTTFSPYNKFTNITRGYLGSTSVYFFIADGTTVFYSENGYDWTNAGSVFPDNATFTSFGQDNNDNFIWLVYSEDTTTSIFYSTNLTTWTQATISNPQTDGWCDFLGVRENSSIAYGWDNSSDRLWVQVGRSGGSFDQAISYDGYNWTGINTGIDCNFVSFGNGVWVKVKTGNLTQPFYYSYDGINWTLMSTTFASNKAVQCLNFGNNRFVAAVRTQFTNVLEIYYSDNGITWTLGSLYPSTVTGSLSQIQYDSQNNRWYVVGNTSVSFAFYSTDNGVTWTDSSPNDALNNSQFDVDACEVLIPTPAPTRSLTPSQTPTNTLTPSPTITPINECLVIYNTGNIANPIYSYNPSNNQSTLLPIPSPGAVTTPNDVAHTSTKLWLNYDTTLQTSVALREWDITLNPWTATFNQDIVLWYGGNSAGLFAVSNNLLILVRKGAPQRVYELDPSQPIVNPTNPVFKFNLPLGYSVAGDYLLTTTNKLLLTMNGPSSGRFLVQIDYSTGLEDFPPIQIGDGTTGLTSPYGIYEWQSNIYIINNNGETSGITTSSPYTLSPFNDIGLNVNGASQISNCLDINLISVSPTPTPTPTNTPSQSITPSITSSVTPTRTVTPTRSVTPTRTVTPTRVTPTPTRTITPTRTLTPTVTPTDYPCNCFAFTSSDPFNSGAVNLYDCRQRLTQLKVSFGMTQYACGFIVSLSPWVSSIAYSAQCATQSTTSIPPGCCLCYQLTFTAGTAPYVFGAPEKYTNCAGQEVSFTASTVGPHYICANSQDKYIQASLGGDFSGFSLSILSGCDSGVCLGITRTPTPTPTRTPTPTLTLTRTPTPTPTVTPTSGATSLCNCITLANTGTTNDGYSYIDCDSTLISDSIDVGFIKSFCAQSIITESEQSQMVTGSTCSVDGDCSNCVCITFTNNTGGQGTYGYRDCDGVTQGPFTIEDGESIQVCGFRVDTGSLSKNIRWSIGGVCEDGVTCPFVLTSESILLWDDINQLVYLYDHLNNTITDIGLVDILGVSPDIARNQSHIWMYELIDSENTTFRQWDITSTNPFSAPTYTDYSITAGTYNGLTVYNSTDTVFAMSSDTVSILRITMSTGNVVKANDFSDVLVSDFIYNPSDNLLIIAGQDTITNNHRILQFDGGGLTGYHNNGGTPIVALYQYGSQLFYIEENFDVYQIDLTSPYTTTYIQTIPGLGRLAGAAQDDPNVITVMFT